jgi:hypothetical protein
MGLHAPPPQADDQRATEQQRQFGDAHSDLGVPFTRVSVVATARHQAHMIVLCYLYTQHDRPAANLTIFNVILLQFRVIDQHADPLAAVGASKALFTLLHGRASVAKIGELKGHTEFGVSDQRDDCLQIVAILAGYPQLILLHLRGDLDFAVFDEFVELAASVGINPFAHRDRQTRLGDIGREVAYFQTIDIDAALGQPRLQDLEQLLGLKLAIGDDGQLVLVALDPCFTALEIETLSDFSIGLVDSVGKFMFIDFGYDIERWH